MDAAAETTSRAAMDTRGTEKGLARFSKVSFEMTNWVVEVPMSMPTL